MATARAACVARLSSGAFASGSRGSRGGKPRGGGSADDLANPLSKKTTRARSKRGASKSFIILPADGGFAGTEDGGVKRVRLSARASGGHGLAYTGATGDPFARR